MIIPKNVTDIRGQKFGRWTVERYAGKDKHNAALWSCVCDCGNRKDVTGNALRTGKSKSCGCLQRETASRTIKKAISEGKCKPKNGHSPAYKHGGAGTHLHKVWQRMRRRCRSKGYEHYDRYGGRGIKVCDEWDRSFPSFRDWAMSHGYEDGLEIDRIDNNGDYCPDNCRWATRTEQVRNRSNTIHYEINGETKTLKEWCDIFGIKYKLAHERHKKGWSTEEIFDTTGEHKHKPPSRKGIQKKYNRDDISIDYISEKLKEGKSLNSIANDLGCGWMAVKIRQRDILSGRWDT